LDVLRDAQGGSLLCILSVRVTNQRLNRAQQARINARHESLDSKTSLGNIAGGIRYECDWVKWEMMG
jgi:hypothetical protein